MLRRTKQVMPPLIDTNLSCIERRGSARFNDVPHVCLKGSTLHVGPPAHAGARIVLKLQGRIHPTTL